MNDNKHPTEKHTHDYRDTIKEAAEIEDDGRSAYEKEKQFENELAYEALAVNSSMGMIGMEDANANLLQLELAQELLYNVDRNREDRRDPLD